MEKLTLLLLVTLNRGALHRQSPAKAGQLRQEGEFEMLQALNEARTNPKSLIPLIQSQLNSMDADNVIWVKGRSSGIKTKEGKPVYEEAIEFLKRAKVVGPMAPSYGMTLAARDHCADIGLNEMDHTGGDGSAPAQRVELYGKWEITVESPLEKSWSSGISQGGSVNFTMYVISYFN